MREFATVFIRDSEEKNREAAVGRHSIPKVDAFIAVARALPSVLMHKQPIFLQTSSSRALSDFKSFSTAAGIAVSHTDNARANHDLWGTWRSGRRAAERMEQGTVAAVNLHIGSQAAVLIGPPASAWTEFVQLMMRGEVEYFVCCGCYHRDRFRTNQSAKGRARSYIANLVVAVTRQHSDAPRPHMLESPSQWLLEHKLKGSLCKTVYPTS